MVTGYKSNWKKHMHTHTHILSQSRHVYRYDHGLSHGHCHNRDHAYLPCSRNKSVSQSMFSEWFIARLPGRQTWPCVEIYWTRIIQVTFWVRVRSINGRDCGSGHVRLNKSFGGCGGDLHFGLDTGIERMPFKGVCRAECVSFDILRTTLLLDCDT